MSSAAAALVDLLQGRAPASTAHAVVQQWAESTPTADLLATAHALNTRRKRIGRDDKITKQKRRRKLLPDADNDAEGDDAGVDSQGVDVQIPHVGAAILLRVLLDGTAEQLRGAIANSGGTSFPFPLLLRTCSTLSAPQHAPVQRRVLAVLSAEQLAYVWCIPARQLQNAATLGAGAGATVAGAEAGAEAGTKGTKGTKGTITEITPYSGSHPLVAAAYSSAVATHKHLGAALRHVSSSSSARLANDIVYRLLSTSCSKPELAATVVGAILLHPDHNDDDVPQSGTASTPIGRMHFAAEMMGDPGLETTLVDALCMLDAGYSPTLSPTSTSSPQQSESKHVSSAALVDTGTGNGTGNGKGKNQGKGKGKGKAGVQPQSMACCCPVDAALAWAAAIVKSADAAPARKLLVAAFAARLTRAAAAVHLARPSAPRTRVATKPCTASGLTAAGAAATAASAAAATAATNVVLSAEQGSPPTPRPTDSHQHLQSNDLNVVRVLLGRQPNLDLAAEALPAGSAPTWQSALSTLSSTAALSLLQMLDPHHVEPQSDIGGGGGGKAARFVESTTKRLLPPVLGREALPIARLVLNQAKAAKSLSEFVQNHRTLCTRFIAASGQRVLNRQVPQPSAGNQALNNHQQSPASDRILIAAVCSVDILLLPGVIMFSNMVPRDGSAAISALHTRLKATLNTTAIDAYIALCLEPVDPAAGAGALAGADWLRCLTPRLARPAHIAKLVKQVHQELTEMPFEENPRSLKLLWSLSVSISILLADLPKADAVSTVQNLLTATAAALTGTVAKVASKGGADRNGARNDGSVGSMTHSDSLVTLWSKWILRYPLWTLDGNNAEEAQMLVLEMLKTLSALHSALPRHDVGAAAAALSGSTAEMIELVHVLTHPRMGSVLSAAAATHASSLAGSGSGGGVVSGGDAGGGGSAAAAGAGLPRPMRVCLPACLVDFRMEAVVYLSGSAATWFQHSGGSANESLQQVLVPSRGDAAALIAIGIEAACTHTSAFTTMVDSGGGSSGGMDLGTKAMHCGLQLLGHQGEPTWLGAKIASEARTHDPNLLRLCRSVAALSSAAARASSASTLNTSAQFIASLAMLNSTTLTVLVSAGTASMLLEVLETGVALGNVSLALQMLFEEVCSAGADAAASEYACIQFLLVLFLFFFFFFGGMLLRCSPSSLRYFSRTLTGYSFIHPPLALAAGRRGRGWVPNTRVSFCGLHKYCC